MPELQVEVAARNLRQWLVGEVIAGIDAPDAKVLAAGTAAEWQGALCGRRCEAVTRRAKYLLLAFEGEHTVVVHLRMTGKFVLVSPDAAEPAHVRFGFVLPDSRRVLFRDLRRFGRLWLLPTASVARMPGVGEIGAGCLSGTAGAEALAERARRSRRPVKTWLMDQTVIRGWATSAPARSVSRPHLAAAPGRFPHRRRVAPPRRDDPDYLEWAIRTQLAPGSPTSASDAPSTVAIYARGGNPCPRCGFATLARRVQAGQAPSTARCASRPTRPRAHRRCPTAAGIATDTASPHRPPKSKMLTMRGRRHPRRGDLPAPPAGRGRSALPPRAPRGDACLPILAGENSAIVVTRLEAAGGLGDGEFRHQVRPIRGHAHQLRAEEIEVQIEADRRRSFST